MRIRGVEQTRGQQGSAQDGQCRLIRGRWQCCDLGLPQPRRLGGLHQVSTGQGVGGQGLVHPPIAERHHRIEVAGEALLPHEAGIGQAPAVGEPAQRILRSRRFSLILLGILALEGAECALHPVHQRGAGWRLEGGQEHVDVGAGRHRPRHQRTDRLGGAAAHNHAQPKQFSYVSGGGRPPEPGEYNDGTHGHGLPTSGSRVAKRKRPWQGSGHTGSGSRSTPPESGQPADFIQLFWHAARARGRPS